MGVDWPELWYPIESDEERAGLERELSKELSAHHELHNRAVRAVARRSDCDDVLYAHESGEVSVVRLTWKGGKERVGFPWTQTFNSLDAFAAHEQSEN